MIAVCWTGNSSHFMSEKVGKAVSKFDYEDKKGSSSMKQKESPVSPLEHKHNKSA